MIMKFLQVLTGIAVSFFVISCNRNSVTELETDSQTPVKVESITLNKDVAYLSIGEKFEAEALIEPDSADKSKIKWCVYNPQVAFVDTNGKIEGISCGTTQIAAYSGQVKKEMKVVVRALEKNKLRIHFRTNENTNESYKEYGIYLSGYALSGYGGEGDAYKIKDTIYDFRHLQPLQSKDSFGMYTDIPVVECENLNAAVLKNNGGYNDFTDASLIQKIDLLSYNEIWFIEGCKTFFIAKPVTGLNELRFTGDSKTIKVGGSADLKTVLISSITPVSGLLWQSSNQFVASVNNNGIITGVSPGTAVIMALAGGLVATKQITIVPAINDSCVRIHYCRYNNDYTGWAAEYAGKSYTFTVSDAFGSYVDIPVKKGIPFTFKIRSEFETEIEYVDNTGFKRELWVLQGKSEVTDTVPVMNRGALKIVNSWSDKTYQHGDDWEHVKDGSFYMTYDALKKSGSFAYFLSARKAYQPRIIAVIQVESNFRGDFSISFGVGDTLSPRKIKHFLNYPQLSYGGYYTKFPVSDIAVDLTELLPITNENLFLQVDDGGLNRTLKVNKFSVEVYDDYSLSPVQIIKDTALPAFTKDGSTTRFVLKNITISANASLAKAALGNGYEITSRSLTGTDMRDYKSCPARMSRELFQRLINDSKIKLLGNVQLNNRCFGKIAVSSQIDNSKSKYFPPVGSQEQKGSCAAWGMGYYLATYNIAKTRGWDLSGARWLNGEIADGYKDKIMSPDFLYNLINKGKDEGSMAYDAALTLCDIGIATMNTAPIIYDTVSKWPNEQAFREAPLYRHDESTIFYCIIKTDKDIENIKSLLKAGELLTLAIQAGGMVLSGNDTFTSESAGTALDHLVTVTGFDDNWTVESK